MAGTEYHFDGLDRMENQLMQMVEQRFPAEFERLVIQLAYELQGKVKTRTPKKTSRLADSWAVGPVRRNGTEYVIEVYTNVKYAGHVEYGHRTRGGAGFVPGRHMMELSLEEVRRALPPFLKAWLNDFLTNNF